MKRFVSASVVALFGSACVALAAAPGCSGSSAGSGFGNPGNPDQPGQDGGNPQGSDDGSGGTYDTGSFGTLHDTGGLLDDASCATATAQASRQPVYMLFVLDGSGSMASNNKWTAATAALQAIFQDFQTKADPSFGVGINVFCDANDPTCGGFSGGGPYPSGADVPIAFVSATQEGKLAGRIGGGDMPSGGTPTGAALQGGYTELGNFTPSSPLLPGGKKVLVILTDGVPTDCGTGATSGCINYATAALASAAPKGPITTFVIGTGPFPTNDPSSFDPVFLGTLAKAGGAAPTGCNPSEGSNLANLCYFEVDPTTANATQLTQQFEAAINTIRGQISSCTFALQGVDGGVIDPTKVNVIFTPSSGQPQELTQDPANGWSYDNPSNPTEVILNGQACTNMKNDPMGKISIVLGCATKIPK